MKDIKLEIKKRGIETLILTLTVTTDAGVIVQDINLSGNSTSAALWGATKVVEALRSIKL